MSLVRVLAFAASAAIALSPFSGYAQEASNVRFGFVLNFARFTQWPENQIKPESPLSICVAPGDPDLPGRAGGMSTQSIQGHGVLVRNIQRTSELGNCNVLFLPVDTPISVTAWLKSVDNASILTISDAPDFIDAGGQIGLVLIGSKYRFDINLSAARKSGLQLNNQLLKLARTIK